MGRQIVRVPPGFKHPTDDAGEPIAGAHHAVLHQADVLQRTAYQIYETVSEGTPINPVFKSMEELAAWLTAQGISRAAAEAFIAQGSAPSFVVRSSGTTEPGIEALAPKRR